MSAKILIKSIFSLWLFTLVFYKVGIAQEKIVTKKLIHLGWELTSPQVVKANYKNMEATSPFDGITFILRDTLSNGEVLTEGSVFSKQLIHRNDLQNSIHNIKLCNFTQFKYNFIRVNTVPGNLKWTDDSTWKIVVKNMGTMAWFAKQAGLVGICYDPESYGEHQFKWDKNSGISFEATQVLAKQRGKEIMTEIGKTYPDIVFWGLFLLSFERSAISANNIDVALRSDIYGLYPAFVEGLLEALPITAKMVEGNEDAYYSRDRENLLSIYNNSKVGLPKFLAPANRIKYQTNLSVGLGLYMDMYTNSIGKKYYFGPTQNRTRLERFRDRLYEAMNITDEYVWLYNESYKWWDIPYSEAKYDINLPDPFVEKRLAGSLETALFAKDPIAYLEKKMVNGHYEKFNLVTNSGFELNVSPVPEIMDWTNKDCPAGYLQWRPENSNFAITIYKNGGVGNSPCAKMVGANSVLIKQVAVKPGETYFITVDGKSTGGDIMVSTRFMDESLSNFIDWGLNQTYTFKKQFNTPWLKASGIIKVPETVYTLQLLLIPNSIDKEAIFYFDNISVFELHQLFK